MDKIRVDTKSGQVVPLEVLNEAIPGLHRQGTSRVLQKVLKDFDGVPPSKLRVNSSGNSNIVCSLEACIYLLDKIPGAKWDKWRLESLVGFKDTLIKHVESKIKTVSPTENPVITPITSLMFPPTSSSGIPAKDIMSESEDEENKKHTKTGLMQKHLQAVNIVGQIRIDEETGLASVIDIIRMTSPGVDAKYAAQMLIRLQQTDDRIPSFKSRIEHRKINGIGRVTPLTDVKTLLEILYIMPTAGGKKYRRILSKILCRILNGDMTLCDQMEETNRVFQSTDEGKALQQALGESVIYKEDSRKVRESSVRDKLAEFHNASTEVWTPSGVIDVLTEDEVIEVKYYRNWQRGMGQVLAYGSHYPTRVKRLHLFGHRGDERVDHFVTQAKSVCDEYGVYVTHEEPIFEEAGKRSREDNFQEHTGMGPLEITRDLGHRLHSRVKKAKPEVSRGMPIWFEYASAEEKRAYVSLEARRSIMETEMAMILTYKNTLEKVRPLDEIEKTEIRECFRRTTSTVSSTELSVSGAQSPSQTLVNSASQLQVCNTIDPSTGLQLATPLCALSVRGSETSIPLEAGKIKVRVGDKAGAVGKEVKKLYGRRYGQDAANKIPKRSTIFRGKPFNKNCFFSRDSDLIQQAIRNVCGC